MARPVRVRYERDEAGVQALLLSDGMAGLAVHVASRAKRHAEGLSRPFRETGDYARSFKVVPWASSRGGGWQLAWARS